MPAFALSRLIDEINDNVRNSVSSSLDNPKRVRAINWVLDDLNDFADWDPSVRTVEFDFVGDLFEYSLLNHVATTSNPMVGSTAVSDFKNPKDLRLVDIRHEIFQYISSKDVRNHIRQKREIDEYGIEGDRLIVNNRVPRSSSVHACDSLTADGTWSAAGDASNLTLDEVNFKQGAGSLNFDVTAGTSLQVQNTTMSPVRDLSDFENKGYISLWVYLPTITNLTNVGLRWGNDLTANYWNLTQTAPFVGTLQTGWNRFAFKWEDATVTGSPNAATVDSIRITITFSAATTDTDFRIDDIQVGEIESAELDYYSLSLVQTSAGTRKINFNPDSVTLTEELIDVRMKDVVVEGASYRLLHIVGGRREKDENSFFTSYEKKKAQLRTALGHRPRRPLRIIKFMRRPLRSSITA